ncbi:hypothetical protein RRF57_012731 [Xylaria bambusicola]|uniref:Calcineurin-like phosphoesterase domain-containing protein n=1 Tax=Xylaria bambusicola TaxID=326684 RepID=A0AAN7V4I2_9PEZI
MACDTPGRLLVRTFVLATIPLVLITFFLSYLHFNPIAFTSFRHSTSNKPDEPVTDAGMALNLPHSDKYVAEMKHRAEVSYPQLSTLYPHISTLPKSHLPETPFPRGGPRRLIFIGDVHGHSEALMALLKKAEFRPRLDTVIFTGDMVNKGPDSDGVVRLAMQIGAYGVRGNHEDRVLRAYDYYVWKKWKKSQKKKEGHIDNDTDGDEAEEEEEEADSATGSTNPKNVEVEDQQTLERESENEKGGEIPPENKFGTQSPRNGYGRELPRNKKGKNKENKEKKKKKKKDKDKPHKPATDLDTARSLSPKSRRWLSKRPLILRIGDLGPRYGHVFVVHAGLVPGVLLKDQDPEAVMNMRTLVFPSSASEQEQTLADQSQTHIGKKTPDDRPNLVPSPDRDGTPWAKTWSSVQKSFIISHPHKRPTTVIYGHDAKAGLQLRRYAFGLDSGCGNDSTLTGLILEPRSILHSNSNSDSGEQLSEGEEDVEIEKLVTGIESLGRGQIRHRLVSVSCHEATGVLHDNESEDKIDSEAERVRRRQWMRERRQSEKEMGKQSESESESEDEIDSGAEQVRRSEWMRDWETRRQRERERDGAGEKAREKKREYENERAREAKR